MRLPHTASATLTRVPGPHTASAHFLWLFERFSQAHPLHGTHHNTRRSMSILFAPFVRVRTIERKVLLLLALLVGAVGTYQIARTYVNKQVSINGPLYRVIEVQRGLYADIVNPTLYLHETYFTVHQMLDHAEYGEWSEVEARIRETAALARKHRARAEHWRGQQLAAEIRGPLEDALGTAEALHAFIRTEIIPMLRRGDVDVARRQLRGEGARLFAVHRAAAGRLEQATTTAAARTEREAETLAGRTSVSLDIAAVVAVVLFITCLIAGLRQLVLRPLQRARKHFEIIGAGNYSLPVLTRRGDEFGGMLNALDRMRTNLASAVDDRDASDAAWRGAELKYRRIIECSVQGFYQSTPDGRFMAANVALATMLGYESVEALLAEPAGAADRFYVDLSQRNQFLDLMSSRRFVTGFQAAVRRRDGRVIWISESARVVQGEDDEGLYREGFVEDITSRKEAEQLKSDFVSFVTHQLRTPLAGIRWMLELAQQEQLDADAASFVDDARLSALRLISLVNDMLDIARLESGRLISAAVPTNLGLLQAEVLAAVRPLANAKDQTITVAAEPVPDILVDPQLGRQAVLNLLSNAIKYTPEGGAIAIQTARYGNSVRWSVRDTGIGIAPDAQRRLFEKFYRAENAQTVDTEGTGLGLYLVRLIAERSGGAVSCESIEGSGSTFTLSLPIAAERRAVA